MVKKSRCNFQLKNSTFGKTSIINYLDCDYSQMHFYSIFNVSEGEVEKHADEQTLYDDDIRITNAFLVEFIFSGLVSYDRFIFLLFWLFLFESLLFILKVTQQPTNTHT